MTHLQRQMLPGEPHCGCDISAGSAGAHCGSCYRQFNLTLIKLFSAIFVQDQIQWCWIPA